MGDEIHDTITTKNLRLVDNDGRERAVFGCDDNGVHLNLHGSDAQQRLCIGVSNEGKAAIQLNNGSGAASFSIQVENDGRVLVEGYDSEGIERFKLELKGNGSHTELSFHEKNRKPRMTLIAEDKGPAGLFIMDQHGRALFSTTP